METPSAAGDRGVFQLVDDKLVFNVRHVRIKGGSSQGKVSWKKAAVGIVALSRVGLSIQIGKREEPFSFNAVKLFSAPKGAEYFSIVLDAGGKEQHHYFLFPDPRYIQWFEEAFGRLLEEFRVASAPSPSEMKTGTVVIGGDVGGSQVDPLRDKGKRAQKQWADFCDRLRQWHAAPIVETMNRFVLRFNQSPPPESQRGDIVQECFELVFQMIRGDPLWTDPSINYEDSLEGIERYLTRAIYDSVFPALSQDITVHHHLSTLQFLKPHHFDLNHEHLSADALRAGVLRASSELRKMDDRRSPRAKLESLFIVSALVYELASVPGGRPCGADEFLPWLIFLMLQANPPHMAASLEYIALYRHPALMQSEAGYYYTQFVSALSFLKAATPSDIKISPAEFARGVELYAKSIESRSRPERGMTIASPDGSAREPRTLPPVPPTRSSSNNFNMERLADVTSVLAKSARNEATRARRMTVDVSGEGAADDESDAGDLVSRRRLGVSPGPSPSASASTIPAIPQLPTTLPPPRQQTPSAAAATASPSVSEDGLPQSPSVWAQERPASSAAPAPILAAPKRPTLLTSIREAARRTAFLPRSRHQEEWTLNLGIAMSLCDSGLEPHAALKQAGINEKDVMALAAQPIPAPAPQLTTVPAPSPAPSPGPVLLTQAPVPSRLLLFEDDDPIADPPAPPARAAPRVDLTEWAGWEIGDGSILLAPSPAPGPPARPAPSLNAWATPVSTPPPGPSTPTTATRPPPRSDSRPLSPSPRGSDDMRPISPPPRGPESRALSPSPRTHSTSGGAGVGSGGPAAGTSRDPTAYQNGLPVLPRTSSRPMSPTPPERSMSPRGSRAPTAGLGIGGTSPPSPSSPKSLNSSRSSNRPLSPSPRGARPMSPSVGSRPMSPPLNRRPTSPSASRPMSPGAVRPRSPSDGRAMSPTPPPRGSSATFMFRPTSPWGGGRDAPLVPNPPAVETMMNGNGTRSLPGSPSARPIPKKSPTSRSTTYIPSPDSSGSGPTLSRAMSVNSTLPPPRVQALVSAAYPGAPPFTVVVPPPPSPQQQRRDKDDTVPVRNATAPIPAGTRTTSMSSAGDDDGILRLPSPGHPGPVRVPSPRSHPSTPGVSPRSSPGSELLPPVPANADRLNESDGDDLPALIARHAATPPLPAVAEAPTENDGSSSADELRSGDEWQGLSPVEVSLLAASALAEAGFRDRSSSNSKVMRKLAMLEAGEDPDANLFIPLGQGSTKSMPNLITARQAAALLRLTDQGSFAGVLDDELLDRPCAEEAPASRPAGQAEDGAGGEEEEDEDTVDGQEGKAQEEDEGDDDDLNVRRRVPRTVTGEVPPEPVNGSARPTLLDVADVDSLNMSDSTEAIARAPPVPFAPASSTPNGLDVSADSRALGGGGDDSRGGNALPPARGEIAGVDRDPRNASPAPESAAAVGGAPIAPREEGGTRVRAATGAGALRELQEELQQLQLEAGGKRATVSFPAMPNGALPVLPFAPSPTPPFARPLPASPALPPLARPDPVVAALRARFAGMAESQLSIADCPALLAAFKALLAEHEALSSAYGTATDELRRISDRERRASLAATPRAGGATPAS